MLPFSHEMELNSKSIQKLKKTKYTQVLHLSIDSYSKKYLLWQQIRKMETQKAISKEMKMKYPVVVAKKF